MLLKLRDIELLILHYITGFWLIFGVGSLSYVLDDDEYIKNHRFSVFILYPSWLDNSTGDGYYYVTRNGESVFSCDFLEGKFFDGLVSSHYTKFDTLEELISYEKSKG